MKSPILTPAPPRTGSMVALPTPANATDDGMTNSRLDSPAKRIARIFIDSNGLHMAVSPEDAEYLRSKAGWNDYSLYASVVREGIDLIRWNEVKRFLRHFGWRLDSN